MKVFNYHFLSLLTVFFAIVTLFCSLGNCQSATMDGEWVQVAKVRSGEQVLDSPSVAKIGNNKFSVFGDEKAAELGSLLVDNSSSPNRYKLTMGEGVEDEGKTFNGIWSISGETMLTCVNPKPESSCPKSFSSNKENGNIFIVWARKDTADSLKSAPKNPTSNRQKAIKYIRANMIGRTTKTKKQTTIVSEGKVESDFQSKVTYCNLIEREKSFEYLAVSSTRQTLFDLKEDGSRIEPGRNVDRTYVTKYSIRESKRNGKLLGITYGIANTISDPAGFALAVSISLENDRMKVVQKSVDVEDFFGPNDSIVPGEIEVSSVYQVNSNKKLTCQLTEKAFLIDPETSKKTPKAEPAILNFEEE